MNPNLDALVTKIERWIGHPATDSANPDTVPAAGVFTRNDIEDAMNDHRVDAVRFPLDYTLTANLAGVRAVYSHVGWWATDAVLNDYAGTVVAPDTSDFMVGRWSFNAPYSRWPLYLTGTSFDLHAAAADLLESWAAQVKLQYNLSLSGLNLSRQGQYTQLMDMAKDHRKQMRIMSTRIADDSVLPVPGAGKAWKQATAPPPM